MIAPRSAFFSLFLAAGLAGCASTAPRSGSSSTPIVLGESFTIDSTVLGETRRINVYRPAGYDQGDLRYPVLYMADGGLQEDFHHITGIVQVSVMNGTMRPFLVVGIENTERRRDLTGPTENPEDLARAAAPTGGSARFRRFIRDELMPAIHHNYRTTTETAFVGESLAGLFALETFFREPDLFDTYIAISPSLWWDNLSLARNAAAQLKTFNNKNNHKSRKTLFIAKENDDDSGPGAQLIADALREVAAPGLTWHYAPMPGETHATIFHPAALEAFRTVFAPAPLTAASAFDRPARLP